MISFLARTTESICVGPLCSSLQNGNNTSVMGLVGSTLGKIINIAIIIGGFFMLLYLIWGAFDWITSEGDKEKLSKAQQKMQNAVIGMLIVVGALTIFGVVSGDILGIITKTPDGGWTINLPQLAPSQ